MTYEQLRLQNQLCFPVYAASRLIIREYQPYLDALGITYPQYLVLMVLWETDELSVNDIAHALVLQTNTITPLLQRMEVLGLLLREKSQKDERKVIVSLTDKGKSLREEAATIPLELFKKLEHGPLSIEKLLELRTQLQIVIDFLQAK